MPEPILDLSPLDSDGLREDLPNYQRKWTTLTNVIFKDGRLRPRPGLREPWDIRDRHYPNVNRGVPLAIIEIFNPGSTTVGRAGAPSFAEEIISPTGNTDGDTTGWTGAFTDIDGTVNDGLFMSTSTDDAQTRVTWSNLSNSPERVSSVTVFARIRAAYLAQRAVFNFYWRSGSTDYLVHTATISGSETGEADDWVTISFTLTEDPSNNTQLTVADINAMNIVVEYAGGSSFTYEAVDPAADGNYTDWINAADSTTAAFDDFAGQSNLPWEDKTELDGIKPTAADDDQSWTLPASFQSTFASISTVNFIFWGRIGTGNRAKFELFYRVGGTDYTIDTVEAKGWAGTTVFQSHIASTTNPNTSAAWTQAQLESGEFGIKYIGGNPLTVKGHFAYIEGLSSGTSVELEWMSAYVSESDGDGNSSVLGRDQVWVTNTGMFRLDDVATRSITDVTNSVAVTEPTTAPFDYATLFGQVYVVNGDDPTRRYPTTASVFEALTTNDAAGSGALTGRTVAAFADRILYGWTDDATDGITPERIAYSNRNDGGDHSGASAGTFDLIGSPGGVVKLLPLSEDVLVAYKENGIYNIRQSGSDIAPLIPDLIDAFSGVLAPRTVTATLSPSGTPIHLFLGTSPLGGQNVYMYDGSTVSPVGNGIQNSLTDNLNFEMVGNAFGIADPEEGLYYLFLPEGDQQFPNAGFILHLNSGSWTRFTLSFDVSCAGIWSVPDIESGTAPETPVINARRRVMVGRTDGRLVALDFDRAYDTRWPAGVGAADPLLFTRGSDTEGGEDRINFTCTIETGDARPAEHPGQQATLYRLHLVHQPRAPIPITVSATRDGGINYKATEEDLATSNDFLIGDITDAGGYVHDALDIPQVYSHRPRVRLVIVPTITTLGWNPMFDIAEMWIENQPQGDDP